MPEQDIFNTPEDEARHLAEELREVKEVLREISQRLARLETRAKRAFPGAFPKPTPRKRGAGTSVAGPPTMTPEQVMLAYDEAVNLAKSGDNKGARKHLEALERPDLNLLRTELGASIGKKKPSKPVLLAAVLGRLSESVMLTKHTNRRELIERTEAGEAGGNASNEDQS